MGNWIISFHIALEFLIWTIYNNVVAVSCCVGWNISWEIGHFMNRGNTGGNRRCSFCFPPAHLDYRTFCVPYTGHIPLRCCSKAYFHGTFLLKAECVHGCKNRYNSLSARQRLSLPVVLPCKYIRSSANQKTLNTGIIICHTPRRSPLMSCDSPYAPG